MSSVEQFGNHWVYHALTPPDQRDAPHAVCRLIQLERTPAWDAPAIHHWAVIRRFHKRIHAQRVSSVLVPSKDWRHVWTTARPWSTWDRECYFTWRTVPDGYPPYVSYHGGTIDPAAAIVKCHRYHPDP